MSRSFQVKPIGGEIDNSGKMTGIDSGAQLSQLKNLMKRCVLCPRKCRVDRTQGERGFCGLGFQAVMDCALAHHGEEPPLSGRKGAGTIFFSSCNVRCLYCQNYQISHRSEGKLLSAAELAAVMLTLQEQGCHNVEAVTPTPQSPLIMDALLLARQKGLTVPFVYNCGGYESPEVINLLRGLVDIYLPDFKYGHDAEGLIFSGIKDYPSTALAAIKEMVRQRGDELEMEGDVALRGVIIRHLILPGRLENSFAVLRLIKEHISTRVPLSIMSQYSPIPSVGKGDLERRITRQEYEAVKNFALDLDFENIFTQEVSDRHLTPDFSCREPFVFW